LKRNEEQKNQLNNLNNKIKEQDKNLKIVQSNNDKKVK
jgi:hypothetical protein